MLNPHGLPTTLIRSEEQEARMNKHRVGQTKWKKDRGELRDLEIPGAPVSRENYEAITTQLFVDSFKAELQKSAFNFTFINFVTILFFSRLCPVLWLWGQVEKNKKGTRVRHCLPSCFLFFVRAAFGRTLIASRWDMWEDWETKNDTEVEGNGDRWLRLKKLIVLCEFCHRY